MRRQITKKIIAVALAVLLVLCTSLTASAMSHSGVEFNISGATFKYGTTAGDVNTAVEVRPSGAEYSDPRPQLSFSNSVSDASCSLWYVNGSSVLSKYWVVNIPFNISTSETYGTLKLNTTLGYEDNTYRFVSSSFNGMFTFDNPTEPLGTFEIVNDETARIVYTGKLPTSGYLQFKIFQLVSFDIMILTTIMTYEAMDPLDREEEKAEGSGNDSIDGITNAVPDVDFGGLESGVKSLANAMSYNGTDCVWLFPSLKIPAIKNVTPEVTLSSPKSVDLGAEVRKMPTAALSIIQACCSIGIVLFVVYELYSFIIFCFTLRNNQAGKDEESDD